MMGNRFGSIKKPSSPESNYGMVPMDKSSFMAPSMDMGAKSPKSNIELRNNTGPIRDILPGTGLNTPIPPTAIGNNPLVGQGMNNGSIQALLAKLFGSNQSLQNSMALPSQSFFSGMR